MIVELSKSTFLHTLESAPRGAWILYFVGFLYEARMKNRRLNTLADTVWGEYLSQRACLVQRRLGDKSYEYWAVKR